jgi:ankyrin repeat protein
MICKSITEAELLVEAICSKNTYAVALLLSSGVDPNGVIDDAALTPLHFAVIHDSMESIWLLLAARADMLKENDEGESAFSKAIELCQYDAVQIFIYHLQKYFPKKM